MRKVMRDVLIFWFILAVTALLMTEFCYAKDPKLNIDIGYTHKLLLNTPIFSGSSFIQSWLSNKLGISLPQGEIDYGDSWRIRNDYSPREIDGADGNGVRVGILYNIYQPESSRFSLDIGIDGSFSKFSGEVASSQMKITHDSCLSMRSFKKESFNLNAYQVTLKGEVSVEPFKRVRVSLGAGPTFNLTEGSVGITEGANRNDGLCSQQLWVSSGIYKRRQVTSNIREFNMGAAVYGNVRLNIYGPAWMLIGVRYDYVFGEIKQTIGRETLKAKLNTVEGIIGLRIEW